MLFTLAIGIAAIVVVLCALVVWAIADASRALDREHL